MIIVIIIIIMIVIVIVIMVMIVVVTGCGQMGSALLGSLQGCCFLTDFLGTPVNLLLIFPNCQGVPFSSICQIHDFCSGPISVDPICPQPMTTIIIVTITITIIITITITIIIIHITITITIVITTIIIVNTTTVTPSPPTKSFDFGGFDSSKLLILKGGNSHVRVIL